MPPARWAQDRTARGMPEGRAGRARAGRARAGRARARPAPRPGWLSVLMERDRAARPRRSRRSQASERGQPPRSTGARVARGGSFLVAAPDDGESDRLRCGPIAGCIGGDEACPVPARPQLTSTHPASETLGVAPGYALLAEATHLAQADARGPRAVRSGSAPASSRDSAAGRPMDECDGDGGGLGELVAEPRTALGGRAGNREAAGGGSARSEITSDAFASPRVCDLLHLDCCSPPTRRNHCGSGDLPLKGEVKPTNHRADIAEARMNPTPAPNTNDTDETARRPHAPKRHSELSEATDVGGPTDVTVVRARTIGRRPSTRSPNRTTSASTNCSARSLAAGWASCTAPGSTGSTGSSR